MQSKASTVQEYLSSLPGDRRDAIERVRGVILENLDTDYEEGMSYGAIGYLRAASRVSCRISLRSAAGIAIRRACVAEELHVRLPHGLVLRLCDGVDDTALVRWFHAAWAASGKKLDMGKACIRFKKIEDLPLDVLGEAIRRVPARLYIEQYTNALRNSASARVKGKTPAKARPSKGAAAR